MSDTRVMVTVSGPYGQFTVEASVQPGATFSSIPAPALIELGIEPHRVVRLQSDGGGVQFRQLGRALTTVGGQEDVAPVLFGELGEPAVVGATTLSILLLRWEPDERQLLPMEAQTRAASASETSNTAATDLPHS
jgi:hypothetical protein